MACVSLVLEAPDAALAKRVESLIAGSLGDGGFVELTSYGERALDAPQARARVLRGLAVCRQAEDRMIAAISSALSAFDVEVRTLHSGLPQLVVRPIERAKLDPPQA